ncbi:SDR family oxidoreductase [Aeoliella sp. ICT_H6.2]|uniref:SDR family oxidoreductase n=1 Tax=Aeoliella straminimaris TaxID=2954799 RepID=A0A9X2JJZ8_9BACT|nr:SDR family oxidoreductase [Aeoliella straminimaris]MCO6047413.1 SDR family oxidoreductase [Aeoliella straminimaris]
MGFNVEGCVALVTGANRGIGRTIVDQLLAAGAQKVYAAVRQIDSADPLVDAHGSKVAPVRIDLTDAESIKAAADEASDVHLVVNNAGVLKTADPLDPTAIDALQTEMEVNVYGLLRMAQAFAPVLKANGGGAFVQLNSIASMRSFPAFATYCASKAAAYSITQALKVVLADQGTQVLSVHPGPIDTDMGEEAGLKDIAEPPTLVGEGIIAALSTGDYHLFPDSMAKDLEAKYASFAQSVIEG